MLTHTFLQAKAWNEKVKANFWSENPIEPILRLRAVVPATLVAMYGRVKEQANMQSSNTDPVAQNALRFNLRATGPAVQPARVVGGKGKSTGVSPPLSLPTSAGSVGTGVGTAGAGVLVFKPLVLGVLVLRVLVLGVPVLGVLLVVLGMMALLLVLLILLVM